MFAVSENICIFVIAKVTYKFREINRFHIQNRDKRGVSWYLFFTELIGLWRVNRNAPLHSFIPLTVNFRPMPKSSKNHSEPNNSTQAVSTIHRFRIRITSYLKFINGTERTYTLDKEIEAVSEYEATGKVLKELYKLMPAGNVPLSKMFGTKSCVQLD